MEQQQYKTLGEIAKDALPGERIRHSSWKPGVFFTCSTELLMALGGYPYAVRPSTESLRRMPTVAKAGYWVFDDKYPRRTSDVPREKMGVYTVQPRTVNKLHYAHNVRN